MPSNDIEKDRPGKVFVGGLPPDFDEKDLEDKFSKYGRITEAILIRDKGKSKSRGFGFVTFENPLDGEDAAKDLDGSTLDGRIIHVEQATKPHRADSRRSDSRDRMRAPRAGGRGGFDRRGSGLPPRRGGFDKRDSGSRGMDSRGGRMGDSYERRGGGSRGRGEGRGGFMSRGRGGGRGGSSRGGYGGSRDSFSSGDRRPSMSKSFDRDRSLLGSVPRRGPPSNDGLPPRRSSYGGDNDRYSSSIDRIDRVPDRMDRGPPPRSRDSYPPSPPREYSRNNGMDSRMRPTRGTGSSRDVYSASSREYRDYSPPPTRNDYQSQDYRSDFTSQQRDRVTSPRDRGSSRDYGPPARDYNSGGMSSRNNFGAPSRDSLLGGRDLRDDYTSPRDTFSRETVSSRDYQVSREFSGGSRGMSSRNEYTSPRDSYDSYRESSRPSGPPSRSFSSSSNRDSGIARLSSSRPGPYDSPPSRGPSSRGPPPSRGPPIREERGRDGFSAGSRRPPPSDSRGGPPQKRPRPSGPPRGGGPPFRR